MKKRINKVKETWFAQCRSLSCVSLIPLLVGLHRLHKCWVCLIRTILNQSSSAEASSTNQVQQVVDHSEVFSTPVHLPKDPGSCGWKPSMQFPGDGSRGRNETFNCLWLWLSWCLHWTVSGSETENSKKKTVKNRSGKSSVSCCNY